MCGAAASNNCQTITIRICLKLTLIVIYIINIEKARCISQPSLFDIMILIFLKEIKKRRLGFACYYSLKCRRQRTPLAAAASAAANDFSRFSPFVKF